MPVVRAPTVTRPPLLQRIANHWRDARAAALLEQLPHGAVGLDMPAPSAITPRVHATLKGIAHPAVWEVGIPATAAVIAGAIWRQGWDAYWPRYPETRILFLLAHPVWIMLATTVGQLVLRRRYARMAREEYSRRVWRADERAGA